MARPRTDAKRCKVLIVEDEFLIAMELVEVLEDAGYEVVGPATTVKAALEMLDRDRPHVCVLDVNLRGEHSAPVAAALVAHNVPFVLSSAYERVNLEQIPAFSGVTNIGKPASQRQLLSTLAALLQN